MRFCIVKNSVVINTVEADEGFAINNGFIQSDTANIGDVYDGVSFTTPISSEFGTQKYSDETEIKKG